MFHNELLLSLLLKVDSAVSRSENKARQSSRGCLMTMASSGKDSGCGMEWHIIAELCAEVSDVHRPLSTVHAYKHPWTVANISVSQFHDCNGGPCLRWPFPSVCASEMIVRPAE